MLKQFNYYLKNKKKSFYMYIAKKLLGPSFSSTLNFEPYDPNDKTNKNVTYVFKSGLVIPKIQGIKKQKKSFFDKYITKKIIDSSIIPIENSDYYDPNDKVNINASSALKSSFVIQKIKGMIKKKKEYTYYHLTLFRALQKPKKNNKRVKKTINLYAYKFFCKPQSFKLLFYNNYNITKKPKYLVPLFCYKYILLLNHLINNGTVSEKKKIKFALYNLVYYLTKNQVLVEKNKKIYLRSNYLSEPIYRFFLNYLILKKKSISTIDSFKNLFNNYPGNITFFNFYNTSLFFFYSYSDYYNTDFYDQRDIWSVNNFSSVLTSLPNNYDRLNLTVYPSKSVLRKNINYKRFGHIVKELRNRYAREKLHGDMLLQLQYTMIAVYRRIFSYSDSLYLNYEKNTFFNNLKFFLLKLPFFRKVKFRRLKLMYMEKRKFAARNNYLKKLSTEQGHTFIYGSEFFPKISSYKSLFMIFVKLINYQFKKLLSNYRIKFMAFGKFNKLEIRKWRGTFRFLKREHMISPYFVEPTGPRFYYRNKTFWAPPKYRHMPRFMNLQWERFILFNPFRLNSPFKRINYFNRIDLYIFVIYLFLLGLFFADPYLINFDENMQNKIYSIIPCSFYILSLLKYKTIVNYFPFIFLLYSLFSLLLYFLFHIFLQISRYLMIDFVHLRPSKHQKYKSQFKFRFRIFRKFEYRIPASFITTIILFTSLINLPLPYYDVDYFYCSSVDFNLKFILNNYFLIDYNANFSSKLALNFVLVLFFFHYLFHVYFDLFRRYNFVNFLYKLHLYYYCLFILILLIFFCNNYLILVILIDFFYYCLLKISRIKYFNKKYKKTYLTSLFKRFNIRVRKHFFSQFSTFDHLVVLRDSTVRMIMDYVYGFRLKGKTIAGTIYAENLAVDFSNLNFIGTKLDKLLKIISQAIILELNLSNRIDYRRLKFGILSAFLSILYLYICTKYLIFNNYTYVSFYNSFFFNNFKDLFVFDLQSVLSIFLMISILLIKLGLGVFEFRHFRIICLFDNVTNAVYFSSKFISFLILLKFISQFQPLFFYKNYLSYNSLDYIALTKKIDLIKFSLDMFILKYDLINFSLPSTYDLIFSFISISSMHYYYIFTVSNIFLLFSFIKVIFFPIRPNKRYFTKTFRFLIIKNDIRWAFIQASILHNTFLIFSILNNLFPIKCLLIISFFYACCFTFAIILLDIFIDQSSTMTAIVERLKYYFSGIPARHYTRYPFLIFFLVTLLCCFGFTFPYFGFFLKFYLLLNNFYIFNFFILLVFVYVLKKYSSNVIGTNFYTYIFDVISPAYKNLELMYQKIFKHYYKSFSIHLYISKVFNFNIFLFLLKNTIYLLINILILII